MKHAQSKDILSPLFVQHRELIEEFVQKHGVLLRKRKVQSLDELLFLLDSTALMKNSLVLTSEIFSDLFRQIRNSSVYERVCSLKPVLRDLLRHVSTDAFSQAQELVLLIDGTVFCRLGAKTSNWRGHLGFDLSEMKMCFAELTSTKDAEGIEYLPGDVNAVLVGDKNYAKARIIADGKAKTFVLRYSPRHCCLYESETGKKVDVLRILPGDGKFTHRLITIKDVFVENKGTKRSVTVYAKRVPEDVYRKRIKDLKRKASRNQTTVSKESLEYARWTFLCTSEPWENPEEAYNLYRFRWQIELAIKRWKSVLKVGEFNAKKVGEYGEVMLLTHFLYAMYIEKRVSEVREVYQSRGEDPIHQLFQLEHLIFTGALLRIMDHFRYNLLAKNSSLTRGKRKEELFSPQQLTMLT